jgi:hypothetical protein
LRRQLFCMRLSVNEGKILPLMNTDDTDLHG